MPYAVGPAQQRSGLGNKGMTTPVNGLLREDEPDQIDSRLPLWLACLANFLAVLWGLPFFWTPHGAQIRFMGWILWLFIVAIGTPLVVLPLVLFNLKRLRGRTWPKYAIGLALTPIPVAMLVERIARAIIGYGLAP
jgi:hypothetical protein